MSRKNNTIKNALIWILVGVLLAGIWYAYRQHNRMQQLEEDRHRLERETLHAQQLKDSLNVVNAALVDSLLYLDHRILEGELAIINIEAEKDSILALLHHQPPEETVETFNQFTANDQPPAALTPAGVVAPIERIRNANIQMAERNHMEESLVRHREIVRLQARQIETLNDLYHNCLLELTNQEYTTNLYEARLINQAEIHKREIEELSKQCFWWKVGLGALWLATLLL